MASQPLVFDDLGLVGPQIMAVLNVTPDSFSDGGLLYSSGLLLDRVIDHAHGCVEAGARVLDVGGESTRPGAAPISVDEELSRVIPVIEALRQRFDVVISVDTSSPEVMREATSAGARLINDVRALSHAGAVEAALAANVPVCVMHMQGTPQLMQVDPKYSDPVSEVLQWLLNRADALLAQGFQRGQLVLDPGFGFGKTLRHNVALFQSLNAFVETGYPIVVGVSRKSMLGEITGRPVHERVVASAVAAAMAVSSGAALVRVHDVAATRDAILVMQTLTQGCAQ